MSQSAVYTLDNITEIGLLTSGLHNYVTVRAIAPDGGAVSHLGGVEGKYGFSTGIFWRKRRNEDLFTKFEVRYLSNGFNQVSAATGKVGRINKYSYLQGNSLVGCRLFPKVYIYVGPTINALLSSSGKQQIMGTGQWVSSDDLITSVGPQYGKLPKVIAGLHVEAEIQYNEFGFHLAFQNFLTKAAQITIYRQTPTYNNFYYSSLQVAISYTLFR